MTEIKIDLYSDTHSKPSAAMKEAMMAAEVGDEQQQADPTTNRLQDMVAELLGKEAALFLPSGTMCNQIAYRVWCRPGDEVIADKTSHTIHHETGGPAAHSGVLMQTLDGVRGVFTGQQVTAALRPDRRHSPRSALLSVENTSNIGNGKVWPIEAIEEVCEAAHEAGLKTHMDGARLLNAVVESGISAASYAAPFDSLWIDLSKGLGCPIGGVLAGGSDFIEEAWRLKHMFGGAMRQSGIIAAAGIYALENNVERLAEDHANARTFATRIAQIPGISIDVSEIETNLVYFDVGGTGKSGPELSEALKTKGIHIGSGGGSVMRAVTHLDVDEADVIAAAEALADVAG